MTKTVATLVELGLATKAGHGDDRRKVLIATTPAGADVVIETRRRRDDWLTPRLAVLTPAERRVLAEATDIMRRLAQP
jgi:DNA-binding MarR family transcriptional regulator